MLDLILIRHAHAGTYTEPDFDRSLSTRGEIEAQQAAQVIKYSNLNQGTWLISSAKRTQETADFIQSQNESLILNRKNEAKWYEAGGHDYYQFIQLETCTTIYLIGHNPSISYLASYLSNEDIFMETGNIIHLQWKTLDQWSEISTASAEINYHFHGK